MVLFRAFQIVLIIVALITAIFQAKAMIVDDVNSTGWTFLLTMVLFGTIFLEAHIQNRRRKAEQDKDGVAS